MKKKETIITYTLMIIMCLGIFIGSMFGGVGTIISTIVTSATAVVSAIAVYIQMRKDTEITQAEFLLEFSKFFYSFEGAQKLEAKIDRSVEKGQVLKITSDDYEEVNDYMIWLEGLASMVINKTLTLKLIDNMYNYRFFALVNNPYIQQSELSAFGSYYRNIFKLHYMWSEYRKEHGKEILYEKYDLSKLDNYESVVKGEKYQDKLKRKQGTYDIKKNRK
jgi:hypothetical protein